MPHKNARIGSHSEGRFFVSVRNPVGLVFDVTEAY
jgi:hypothetical protein